MSLKRASSGRSGVAIEAVKRPAARVTSLRAGDPQPACRVAATPSNQASAAGAPAWDPPSYLTSFIGRCAEHATIDGLLRDPSVRWLTLTGPGGVGKTRLAIESACAFIAESGTAALFSSLVEIATEDALLAQLAGQLEPLAPDLEPLATIQRWAAGRTALLLLDNAELLLASGGTPSALLKAPGCEQVKLLVTSRAPFVLTGEHVFPIEPMAAPDPGAPVTAGALEANDAMRLFVARARAANAKRPVDATDAEPVAAICRRLDGLPLAIELAAARMDEFTPAALLARLDRRLPMLTHAPRDAITRHRTMRAAIAWQYELLPEAQQRLLLRLAVFSGGFSQEMAARMIQGRQPGRGYPHADGYGFSFPLEHRFADPGPREAPELDAALPLAPLSIATEAGLEELRKWSLIARAEGPEGQVRFVMLETIREFALEQLVAGGEDEAVRHAHAAMMLAFVQASNEGIWVNTKRRWGLETVDAELGNIRSATEWLLQRGSGAADLALCMTDTLGSYWQMRGMLREGQRSLERALAPGTGTLFRRSNAYTVLGFLNWIMGDDERAETALTTALALAEQPGGHGRTSIPHFYLALVEWRKGPHRVLEMVAHLDLAEATFAAWDDAIGLGVCKLALGEVARLTADTEGAVERFDEAYALHTGIGYDWGAATSRYFAGEARRDQERFPEAAALIGDGLRRYWALGDAWGAGGCVCGLACIAAARTEWDLAARLFGAAQRMRERIHAVLPPTHQEAYDAIGELVRAQTGDDAFQAGRLLAPEEAVAEALAVGERFARGEPPFHAALAAKKLTRMQTAVMALFAQGLDQEQIAKRLDRDLNTIYMHTKAVRDAWGLLTYEELRECTRALGLDRLATPPA